MLQTAVLQFQLHFCQALSSCPAWLGWCSSKHRADGFAVLPGQSRAAEGESGVLNTLKALVQFPCFSWCLVCSEPAVTDFSLLYAGRAWLWFVFLQRSLGFIASQKQKQLKTDQGKTSCIIRLCFCVIWDHFALGIQTNFKNWKLFCCLCLIIKPEDSLTGAVGVLRGWKPDVMYKILLLGVKRASQKCFVITY